MQLIMQKLLAMAVSTVMTKLMIVFKVSFFITLIFLNVSFFYYFSFSLCSSLSLFVLFENVKMTK